MDGICVKQTETQLNNLHASHALFFGFPSRKWLLINKSSHFYTTKTLPSNKIRMERGDTHTHTLTHTHTQQLKENFFSSSPSPSSFLKLNLFSFKSFPKINSYFFLSFLFLYFHILKLLLLSYNIINWFLIIIIINHTNYYYYHLIILYLTWSDIIIIPLKN